MHRNKHKEAAKMGRQRNRSQMKEQENPPGEELNKLEASNLSDKVQSNDYKDAQQHEKKT